MDLTILIVVLLIGIGIPIRNKLIRKYREKKKRIINKIYQLVFGFKIS